MGISAVISDYSINQIAVDLNTKTEYALKISQPIKTDESAVSKYGYLTDGYVETDDVALFKEVVSDFDITSISQNDAAKMYRELYENDLINLKDLYVTFDYSKFPTDESSSSSSLWESSSSDTTINMLDSLREAQSSSETLSVVDTKKSLELAEKIYFFQKSK